MKLTQALLLAGFVAQAGCTLFLVPMMRGRAFKEELAKAPVIPNPASTGQIDNQLITGADGVTYRLTAWNEQAACFNVVDNVSPREAQRMSFVLQGYLTPEDKDEQVPALRSAPPRVLSTSSRQEPVQRTAHDTTRDAQGQIIATTDRQVTEMVTVFETEMEVCFARPTVVTQQTQWMVLRDNSGGRNGSYGVWKLYDPNAPTPPPPAPASQASAAR
jgi:hypothetical protein